MRLSWGHNLDRFVVPERLLQIVLAAAAAAAGLSSRSVCTSCLMLLLAHGPAVAASTAAVACRSGASGAAAAAALLSFGCPSDFLFSLEGSCLLMRIVVSLCVTALVRFQLHCL